MKFGQKNVISLVAWLLAIGLTTTVFAQGDRPGAPTKSGTRGMENLTFTAGSDWIVVHWTDTTNSRNYKCRYRVKDSGDRWSEIDDIQGSNGEFDSSNNWYRFGLTINNLECGTEYEIKIKRKGSLYYALQDCATTSDCDPPPPPPNQITATLVFGTDFWVGDGSAPGLFRADSDGVITNYRYLDSGWETRTTWGLSALGSMVRTNDGNAIYGVSPGGDVFIMRQEDGELVYWNITTPEAIQTDSLVYSNHSWSGDDTAPGVFGVDANNQIVNLRWIDGDWDVRNTLFGGNAVSGSLVAAEDGGAVYGVNEDGNVFLVRQELGELVYWVLNDAPSSIVPGSLVWSNHSWSGDNTAPGLYGVDVNNKVINILWGNDGWEYRTTSWGVANPTSLIPAEDGRAVYGVSPNNRVFLVRQEAGELVYWIVDNDITIAPNSLVWSNSPWSGDNTAPGLYGVDLDNKIVNFLWEDGGWTTRTTWGAFVPGTLVRSNNGDAVYGISTDGSTRLVREESGVLINWDLD